MKYKDSFPIYPSTLNVLTGETMASVLDVISALDDDVYVSVRATVNDYDEIVLKGIYTVTDLEDIEKEGCPWNYAIKSLWLEL